MPTKILTTVLLLICISGIAQDTQVVISEKEAGKRIVLMAENKTNDTLHVFLMVHSEGYRKSASRPVLKPIPPFRKIPMITLIEIPNIPSSYTYDLVINEKENNMNLSMEKKAKDIERVISGKLVLFTLDGCEKCDLLSESLTEQNIIHRTFNIGQDPVLYQQFISFISKDLTSETKIKFPVIWNKDQTIFGYENLEEIIEQIDH